MNLHAWCTSGECALPFSASAPLLRARSCEYIWSCEYTYSAELYVEGAGAARGAGSRVQGEQVCRELSAAEKNKCMLRTRGRSVHLSDEIVNAEEEDKCAQQSA